MSSSIRLSIVNIVLGGLLAGIGAGIGCSSPDLSGPGTTDLTQVVWTVSLNTHTILMSTAAPYDTLQLTAQASTVSGAPLPDAPAVTFTTSDSTLRVSSTGLLTARSTTHLSRVIATVVYHGIRAADTAWVNVTDQATPPAFRQIQIALQPGDSAKMSVSIDVPGFYHVARGKSLVIGALDSTQTNIASSMVALRTSNPLATAIYDVDPINFGGALYPIVETVYSPVLLWPTDLARSGDVVTVYASATVYGITRQDSLQILITPRLYADIGAKTQRVPGTNTAVWTLADPNPLVIQAGGYVVWNNNGSRATDSLDVMFDDSTAASPDLLGGFPDFAGGNIAAFADVVLNQAGDDIGNGTRTRQFLRVGRFPWHSPRTGLAGVVIVQ